MDVQVVAWQGIRTAYLPALDELAAVHVSCWMAAWALLMMRQPGKAIRHSA